MPGLGVNRNNPAYEKEPTDMNHEITYEIQAETILTFCENEHVEVVWAWSSDSDYCATCDDLIDDDNKHILVGDVVATVEWNDSEPLPFGIKI